MASNSSLKVWVMTNEFQPNIVGGLGIVATHLSRMLSRAGVKVKVLCTGRSGKLVVSKPGGNMHIVRMPKNKQYFSHSARAFKANAVLRAAEAAGSGKPDLIHVHSTEFADAAAAAKNKFRIPIVYTCHSNASEGIHSIPGKNQAKLIRGARKIVVPSRWQAGAVRRSYGGDQGRFAVIPHGVNSVSRRTGGNPKHLLFVGRLIPSKGIKPLIKAIALLSNSHKNVRLTVVGSGKKSYMNHLRAFAKQLGVSRRIRWLGSRPHNAIQRMYASHGAVIVPSEKESFCLVALEAMANGVPLVSTLSGGLKEFVNNRNAQIIHSINGPSIARAIAAMWVNKISTKRRRLNAKATAARYRWPKIAQRYKSLFWGLKKARTP
ncbi:glycosyltransferase family 4 protein [Paenibacillus oenotherae]|uniref:Glycosyltransferase family 4 protein n=1 Tax=Paenibacillus oenotherae TaxID=1435645 RepID=A0ABS7D5W6_9BACL|nr:glycosyltransferase family 4 protein [Paenibacillus oenotherae]MBW7475275.1 glycosyltransferase family 4 protein [Paenibacillus oenotherae]